MDLEGEISCHHRQSSLLISYSPIGIEGVNKMQMNSSEEICRQRAIFFVFHLRVNKEKLDDERMRTQGRTIILLPTVIYFLSMFGLLVKIEE